MYAIAGQRGVSEDGEWNILEVDLCLYLPAQVVVRDELISLVAESIV